MVWAAKHEKFLIFGGESQTKSGSFDFHNDLWEYTPKTNEWKEIQIEGTIPVKTAYHAAAWDSQQNLMWVYGGTDNTAIAIEDLWKFDPGKKTWEKVWQGTPKPPKRLSPTLHYDSKRNQLVLFSGLTKFAANSCPEDLWVFDIAKGAWSSKKSDAPGRWQCASAIDNERELLVIQGGYDGAMKPSNQTWVYDLKKDKWRKADNGPKPTDAHSAVCNPATGDILFYGGAAQEKKQGFDELWIFNPKSGKWATKTFKDSYPGPRAYHAAAWNSTDKTMFLFGGTENQFNDKMSEAEGWELSFPASN